MALFAHTVNVMFQQKTDRGLVVELIKVPFRFFVNQATVL